MKKPPTICVIAHNIRSTHNVGSFFRTCDGFGVARLYLTGYTPYPATASDTRLPHIATKLTAKIRKTAIGAEENVPFTHFERLEEAVEALRAEGYVIWALEQDVTSIFLNELPVFFNESPLGFPKKIALLVGNEVEGLGIDELEKCSLIIELPMYGRKESFNVGVALGVGLYGIIEAANST